MEFLVRAKTVEGATIEGYFCRHEFIKAAAELTAEEKQVATPIPVASDTGGGDGAAAQPTHYICIRDAIQTTGEGEVTANGQTFAATVARFTEIEAGSARAYTGFVDKNGTRIFEGDKIRYQCGVGNYELYTVAYENGKFCVSPRWEWGCNFSPFEQRKCEIVE